MRVKSVGVAMIGLAAWCGAAVGQPSGGAGGGGWPLAEPRAMEQLEYTAPFFPEDTVFDDAITPPDAMLRHPLGKHPASQAEIERCLSTWADQSPRARLFTYATSHQGRPLMYIAISSEENIARLEEIAAQQRELADQRDTSAARTRTLLSSTPAIAWMGYGIHGDEPSGTDAALAAAYYLIAGSDEFVDTLLDRAVVLIDPSLNPDGRERFLFDVQQAMSRVPDVDDQSRMNQDHWPSGRMNHYLFDMNRDWIFGTQPETAGRFRVMNEWYPQLFVDAHEMGTQATYFFTPSVEPVNPHYPAFGRKWWGEFAKDHAAAFDARGWRYYTGDFFDDWYPGYSNSWAAYRGSIGILYEQGGVMWHGIARPYGRVMTYRQTVHHQLTSTLANLRTLSERHEQIKREWAEARRGWVDAEGPFAGRSYALVPDGNDGRLRALVTLLQAQNIEVRELSEAWTVDARDCFGRTIEGKQLPSGTLVINQRQGEAPLVAAIMEFDTRFSAEFLEIEREEIVRRNSSKVYDITAWSLPMMFDVRAYEIDAEIPAGVRLFDVNTLSPERVGVDRRDATQAWVIEGHADAAPALAAKLLTRGVRVRLALRDFEWGGRGFPRGSLIVARDDHAHLRETRFIDTLDALLREHAMFGHAMDTGHGIGEQFDIGGRYFPLLHEPRIAIVGDAPTSPYDFGSIWHLFDHVHGMPAAYLRAESVRFADLRRYDTLIVPSGAASRLPIDDVRQWVEAGGTLIATGSSAVAMAREGGLSSVRLLPDVLADLDEYEIAVLRELRNDAQPAMDSIYAHAADQSEPRYPWDGVDLSRGSSDELERRDDWQRQFSPSGAMLAARRDDEHWLTIGMRDETPYLVSGSAVLMAGDGVEAPVRFGVLEDAPVDEQAASDAVHASHDSTSAHGDDGADEREVDHGSDHDGHDDEHDTGGTTGSESAEHDDTGSEGDEPESVRVGWSSVPAGKSLRLRASGLLWPEASQRLANSAAVTRERVGNGQIILIHGEPAFRGVNHTMSRVLLNAAVFGPSMGASRPLRP